MRQFIGGVLIPLLIAAIALFAAVPAARADVVTEVAKFNGTITDVGVDRGAFQIGGVEFRIRGEFISMLDIDLSDATFAIDEFFFELDSATADGDGAGELMRKSQGEFGPETDPLLAPCGPGIANCTMATTQLTLTLDEARFDTSPRGFRPQIRTKVKKQAQAVGFKYSFEIRLDRGLARERPLFCPGDHANPGLTPDADGRIRTAIRHSFTIAEQRNPAKQISVILTKRWECPQAGRYHLRSR